MHHAPPPAGSLQLAYEAIFQNPISPDLEWHDMRALLGLLGQVAMNPDGNLKVTCNGHVLLLPPPHERNVAESQALLEIRRFLKRTEVSLPLLMLR